MELKIGLFVCSFSIYFVIKHNYDVIAEMISSPDCRRRVLLIAGDER